MDTQGNVLMGTYYEASSIDTGAISFPRLFCSECGHQLPCMLVEEGEHYVPRPKYPHCPYCETEVPDAEEAGEAHMQGAR